MSTDHTPPRTIVYYRRDGIVVTSRFFSAGGYRYEIAHLRNLMQARGSIHIGAVVGVVITVAEAALVIPLLSVSLSPLAVGIAVVALLVPGVAAFFCARRWPPENELLALYCGQPVVLFASNDRLEFGQVARATQRAIEAAQDNARRSAPSSPG
jgi:hypothetical protein